MPVSGRSNSFQAAGHRRDIMICGLRDRVRILAGLLVIVAGCMSERDPTLNVKLDPEPLIWLSDTSVETSKVDGTDCVRIVGMLENRTGSSIRGLKVAHKSCGCFMVELGAEELEKKQSTRCSILIPAKPQVATEMKFTIAGVNGQGQNIEAEASIKASLVPKWDSRIPLMALHVNQGVISGAQIVVDQYQKEDQGDAAVPAVTMKSGPEWIRISKVERSGHRQVRDGVFMTEFDVAFEIDAKKLPPQIPDHGDLVLEFDGESENTVAVRYRAINHDPYFKPAFLAFQETTVGTPTERVIHVFGVNSPESLNLVSSDPAFSARFESEADAGTSAQKGLPVRVTFAPGANGVCKAEIVVERSPDSHRVAVLSVRGKGIGAEDVREP
jgi:PBP1b-binding outer membrane lipoprotein LpoB